MSSPDDTGNDAPPLALELGLLERAAAAASPSEAYECSAFLPHERGAAGIRLPPGWMPFGAILVPDPLAPATPRIAWLARRKART